MEGVGCGESLHTLATEATSDPESDKTLLESMLSPGSYRSVGVECTYPVPGVFDVARESSGPRGSSYRVKSRPYGHVLVKVYKRPQPIDREWMMLKFLAESGLMLAPRPLCRVSIEGTPYLLVTEYIEGVTAATRFIEAARDSARYGGTVVPVESAAVGSATAVLHIALSRCNHEWCRPREASGSDAERWVSRLDKRASIVRNMASSLPVDEAKVVEEAADALEEMARWRWKVVEGGVAMQIHGDLHLYQIYLQPDGRVFFTDFEGEPYKSPGSPVDMEQPERDLAAILRSIDYAAVLALQSLTGVDVEEALPEARSRLSPWVSETFETVLSAYLDTLSRTSGLPGDVDRGRIEFWTVERASYELVYELRYRTGYHLIPATALIELRDRLSGSR